MNKNAKRILFVVNDDWFFISHRLPIALKAKELGYDVHIASGPYEGKSKLKSYGFTHHVFSVARAEINPLKDLKTIWSLFRLYKKVKPDIVHHVTIKPVIFGGIASRLAGVSAVVNAISGLGVIFIARGVGAAIKRRIVSMLYYIALNSNKSITIVQNSDDEAKIKSIARLQRKQLVLIKGSGVDLKKFQYTPIANSQNVNFVLVARMLRDKGIGEYYKAAKLVKQKYPEVKFLLVGGTHQNPSSYSETELTEWNALGVIEWVGHQDNVIEYIKSSSVVVLPSYREGLPKVLLEAGAIGRPVITTDVPGCRDAIIENETGLLVPVKNSEALANAMITLIQAPDLCQSFGQKGRTLVEEEFSIEKVVYEHIKVYDSFFKQII